MTNDLCPHCHLLRRGAHSCMHSMQTEIERLRQALDDVLKETYASQELTEKLHGIAGAALGHEPSAPHVHQFEPVEGFLRCKCGELFTVQADVQLNEPKPQPKGVFQEILSHHPECGFHSNEPCDCGQRT